MTWYERCYSRLLIDNHITDLREEYMSRFSPEEYVRLVKMSGVEASMVYACDHNGNCYFPSRIGHVHKGLNGRDIFGETTALLRKEGVSPIAYYTVTYHRDCAEQLPHTSVRSVTGSTRSGRYKFTCPNQRDAVEFYKKEIAEVLQYDLDGIFLDMTFWPKVCCCDACRQKFGRPIPEIIDWDNPEWVAFQRFREDSLAAFAEELTVFVRKTKPGISVTHQFSPVLHGWYMGQSTAIAEASDYSSGDFYGGKLQHRFGAKVFDAFSSHRPFEFMTSRCVNLYDHTSTKSDDELFFSALTSLANGGAYFFIDAINSDGTLHEPFYHRLQAINRKLRPYKEVVAQTKVCLDAMVGIYFSMNSCVNREGNGVSLKAMESESSSNMVVRRNSVNEEMMGLSELLNKMHVPYKVITERETELSGYKIIFLCQSDYLTVAEYERLRGFVCGGGTLFATGCSSLHDRFGGGAGDFALTDVFGIHFTGDYSPEITYTGEELISAKGKVPLVQVEATTEVRALLTFPDFPVGDSDSYASIHSNPPASKPSTFPAITLHTFGKGRCYWMAAPILQNRQYTQQVFMQRLCSEFLPVFVEAENLPGSTEVTFLKSQDGAGHLLCLVNYQDELPVIPLHNVRLKLHLEFTPKAIRRVSNGAMVPFAIEDGIVVFSLAKLDEGEFFWIE
ncbi:MAG: beta-galactosidase trimerization domain-containing protein [Victivallales bacterium]|nr:beta-galactosidase trimerization domain-containing protein [Victivallales bacterium]